jgi:amino acid permease
MSLFNSGSNVIYCHCKFLTDLLPLFLLCFSLRQHNNENNPIELLSLLHLIRSRLCIWESTMTVKNLLRYFDGFTRSGPPENEKVTFYIPSLCMCVCTYLFMYVIYVCMYVCMYVLRMHILTYVLWLVYQLLGDDSETNKTVDTIVCVCMCVCVCVCNSEL